MYNYQQYQKQAKLSSTCNSFYNQFLQQNQIRKELNDTFYNNHKKRIDTFVVSAIQKPVKIDEYIIQKYNPRAFLKTLKPIKQSFKMNSHTTTQRLKQSQYKNSFLDSVPFKNSSNHKFRDDSSSAPNNKIHKHPIKFTSSCTAMRLMEHLTSSRMNQIQLFQNGHENNTSSLIFQKRLFKNHNKIQSKNMRKLIMPAFNRKVYLNSMKSVLVEHPSNANTDSVDNDKDNNQNHGSSSNKYDLDYSEKQQKKNNKLKKKAHQTINRKQNALQAMIKCGIIKDKLQNSNIRA